MGESIGNFIGFIFLFGSYYTLNRLQVYLYL